MRWKPHDVVALVLAITILVGFVAAAVVRWHGFAPGPDDTTMWTHIVSTMIGALAGYIARDKLDGE